MRKIDRICALEHEPRRRFRVANKELGGISERGKNCRKFAAVNHHIVGIGQQCRLIKSQVTWHDWCITSLPVIT